MILLLNPASMTLGIWFLTAHSLVRRFYLKFHDSPPSAQRILVSSKQPPILFITHAQKQDVDNITVSIGELNVTTNAQGDFQIENIPTGDQAVRFEGTDFSAEYLLEGIEMSETFTLRDIEINGELTLDSSDSECATGATFSGTFSGNTLDAEFTEVDPPAGCGPPESGTFSMEKE